MSLWFHARKARLREVVAAAADSRVIQCHCGFMPSIVVCGENSSITLMLRIVLIIRGYFGIFTPLWGYVSYVRSN
jgi:hypothetical protein